MKKLFTLLGTLVLLGMSSISAVAQDSTPASVASRVDPAIGEAVTYVDVNGNPVATVTVEAMERTWEEYGEYDMPDQGIEYVAFTVTVESTVSRGSVDVSRSDFALQDSAGFHWDASYAEAADGVDIAPLDDDLALASGDSATFLVVFEILQDQPIAHLFWQPESDRLITLAALEGA